MVQEIPPIRNLNALPHYAEKAIQLDPDIVSSCIARGKSLYKNGSYEEAKQAFLQAIQIEGALAEAHTGYAHTLRQLQQNELALKAYQQALSLDPNNADTHNGRGIALSNLERFTEAIGAFRAAIRLDPKQAKYHCNLGQAFQKGYRYEQALEEFDKAIELDPSYARAYICKGQLFAYLNQGEMALSTLAQAVKLAPDAIHILYEYGKELLSQGNLKEAKKIFEQVIIKDRQHIPALLGKAQIFYQEKRYPASLNIYQQIIKRDNTSTEAWLGCINTSCQLQQWPQALNTCNQALIHIKSKGEIFYLQGNILLNLKRYKQAMDAYNDAKHAGHKSEDLEQKITLTQQRLGQTIPNPALSQKPQKSQNLPVQKSQKIQNSQESRKRKKRRRASIDPNTSSSIYLSATKTHPIGLNHQKLKRYVSEPSPLSSEELSLIPSSLERGEALLKHLHYKKAQTVFEQIIQEEPHNTRAYHGLGCALRALGEEEESLNAFRKAEKYRSSQDAY